MVGFGLGALTILGLAVLFSRPASIAPRTAAGSSPLATPSTMSSPAPSPTVAPDVVSPDARVAGAMAYDPENRGVILFGGAKVVHQPDGTNTGVSMADTWLWDGRRWKQLDVQGPPARSAAMAAYDSVRHVIVL